VPEKSSYKSHCKKMGVQQIKYVIQAQHTSKDVYRLTTGTPVAHKYFASTVYSATFLTTT